MDSRNQQQPDLTSAIIKSLEHYHADPEDPRLWTEISPGTPRVKVLKQQTVMHHESVEFGPVSESAALVLIGCGEHQQIVMLAAALQKEGETEWSVCQSQSAPAAELSDAKQHDRPDTGLLAMGFGHYMVAIVAHSPEIGGIRATLANGDTYEDRLTDGVALLFFTLHDPEEWAELLKFETLDREGVTISTEAHWIDPHNPPPAQ